MKNKNIEAFRGVSILVIILYHMNELLFPAGFLFVNFFLVLSGFLLIKSYLKKEHLHIDVLKQRFIKISNMVFPMVTLTMFFLFLFQHHLFVKLGFESIASFLYFNNIYAIIQRISYFDAFQFVSPFKHLWFIALLMQVTCIVYVLFRLFHRKNKFSWRFVLLICGLIVGSFLLSVFYYQPENVSRVYYGLDIRLFSFLVGVLGGYLIRYEKTTKHFSLLLLSLVCASLMTLMVVQFDVHQRFIFNGGFLVFDIVSLLLIIALFYHDDYRILQFTFFQRLGKYAFFLYIWHYPILSLSTKPIQMGFLIHEEMWMKFALLLMSLLILGFIFKTIISKLHMMVPLVLGGILITFSFLQWSMPYTSYAFSVEKQNNQKIQQYTTRPKLIPELHSLKKYVLLHTKQLTNLERLKIEEHIKQSITINYQNIVLVGDSTSLVLGEGIQQKFKNAYIDAKVSRHFWDAKAVLSKFKHLNSQQTAVLLQMGVNSKVQKRHVEPLFQLMPNSDFYLLLIGADSAIFRESNRELVKIAQQFDNVYTIDMRQFYQLHPDLIYPDGVHIKENAQEIIANFVLGHLIKKV